MYAEENLKLQRVMLNNSSKCNLATIASHEVEEERRTSDSQTSLYLYPLHKVRLLASYVTLFGRLIFPVFIAAYSAWLRNQKTVVDGFRRLCIPGVLAVIASGVSLSTLSKAIAIPCGKIDPLLRTFRVIKTKSGRLRFSHLLPKSSAGSKLTPEKSVSCEVLYDPGHESIQADVIFIHGLHGSLEKTWRQGVWDETQGRNVPLTRNNTCFSITKQGNPAMMSIRKQSTFMHSDAKLHGILNQSQQRIIEEKTIKNKSSYQKENNSANSIFSPSDIDVCRNAMAYKVDAIINGVSESENETISSSNLLSRCWPRDWLPIDCPWARVIALNYSTDPFLWRPLWVSKRIRTSMGERAREMMEHLQQLGVGDKPIVWVGHSKGGLFVKQMIVDANESANKMWSGICLNTKGIMFYSVPHRGSPCADITLPLLRQSVEMTEVQKDCREVLELHDKFLKLIDSKTLQADVFSFIETIQTFMAIMYIQIVSFETADPGVGKMSGVPVDHRNICKPTSRDCFLYKELLNLIKKTVE